DHFRLLPESERVLQIRSYHLALLKPSFADERGNRRTEVRRNPDGIPNRFVATGTPELVAVFETVTFLENVGATLEDVEPAEQKKPTHPCRFLGSDVGTNSYQLPKRGWLEKFGEKTHGRRGPRTSARLGRGCGCRP